MRFSYKTKLIFLFSAIVLGTIAGVITTYLNQQTVKINNKWVEHTIAVLYESEKVFSLTQDIVLAERGYVITGDTSYLTSFNEQSKYIYSSAALFRNLVAGNSSQSQRIDSLQKLIFSRVNLSKKNIEMRREKGALVAPQVIKAYRRIGEIRNLVARIQASENKLLATRQATSQASYATLTNSFYTLISFTTLLLSIALLTVRHNLQQEERFRNLSILEAKSKEMEQFTFITSHELRHPVLTLQSYIKIFDEEYTGRLDTLGKNYLTSMMDLTKQMDMLILGLFNYSILSKVKKTETVNCNEIIQTILLNLNSTIQSNNAKIIIQPLPTFKGFPQEIQQLFLSILTNALKFTKMNVSPEITISAKKDSGYYLFEFCDKGIGIEEKNQKKIFNIFKRLHTVEEFEGIGMGLALCKKIVELHHGQIWVKSQLNKGSCFYFTIKNLT